MTEEDGQEKPHEATQRKLDQSREKGDIPRSLDLLAAATYCGLLAFALTDGGGAIASAGATLAGPLANAGLLAVSGAGPDLVAAWLAEIALSLGPAFGLPVVFVAGAIYLQRAWVFAPDKVKPRLSRISPLENARQKFGRNGLFEFAKSAVKLAVISVILGIFLTRHLADLLILPMASPGQVSALMLAKAVDFLLLVSVVALVFGAVDYLWQRAEHLRNQRMSRKELLDEAKDSEGDPVMKQQRRQRAYDIATNRMMVDVPKADVVIVNPRHYAVALRWDRAAGGAPVCVAKGVDEVALRIRTVAMEAGVPIRQDPPTARAIHASVAIGAEIQPEHYRPVAAAIRFAEAVRMRARRRG